MTTREPEYNDQDRAVLLTEWDARNAPRGPHGVLMSEAADPDNNPYSMTATGRFIAEPVVDFAQDAIDRAAKERRKKVGDDDWALFWRVHHERVGDIPAP